MNIGIDARLLGGRITGIGRYLINILKYLPQYDKQNNYYLYAYEGTEFYHSFYNYSIIKRSKLPRQLYEHYWLNFVLPQLIEKQKIDVFFTPYVLVPVKRGNYKNVSVLHDSIAKACKNSYSLHYRTYMNMFIPLSMNRSDVVVTDSFSSKQEIIKYYNVPAEKIEVMHLWTDEEYQPRQLNEDQKLTVRNKYNLPEKFVLYVGVLEDRKNIKGIIKISDILKSKGYDIKFLLVGKKGFGFPEIEKELESRKDRITHLKFVDETSLPLLYNMASVFLFPSNYEGFGLPPLEAMKSGTPVLTSDNTSLPEVVGEGGIMLDSKDYHGFSNNIIRLLEDENYHRTMSRKALKQAEEFTPDNQIGKLISIFNHVAGKRNNL
jgi:glycosyltransferase involved in cell wall biosynthesis